MSSEGAKYEGIERFLADIHSDKQQLRNKLQRLIVYLNGGKSSISVLGLQFDIYNEFEKRIRSLSDSEVAEVLRILRE